MQTSIKIEAEKETSEESSERPRCKVGNASSLVEIQLRVKGLVCKREDGAQKQGLRGAGRVPG